MLTGVDTKPIVTSPSVHAVNGVAVIAASQRTQSGQPKQCRK